MELIKLLVKLIQSRVLFFNHNLRRRSGGDLLELFTDNLASIFKDKFDTTWQSVGSPEFSLRLKNRNKFFIVDKAWSFISVPSLSSVIISPLVPSCPPPTRQMGSDSITPSPHPDTIVWLNPWLKFDWQDWQDCPNLSRNLRICEQQKRNLWEEFC